MTSSWPTLVAGLFSPPKPFIHVKVMKIRWHRCFALIQYLFFCVKNHRGWHDIWQTHWTLKSLRPRLLGSPCWGVNSNSCRACGDGDNVPGFWDQQNDWNKVFCYESPSFSFFVYRCTRSPLCFPFDSLVSGHILSHHRHLTDWNSDSSGLVISLALNVILLNRTMYPSESSQFFFPMVWGTWWQDRFAWWNSPLASSWALFEAIG